MKIRGSFLSFVFLCLFCTNIFAATTSGYVYIVGTGGTIAGSADVSTSSTYEAGKLNAQQILNTIPDINKITKIKALDLFHIDSGDITISNWLDLAKNINQLLKLADVKGVVVTHGTDTMEETAYFLNLVVKHQKPVVLVGSMRPATSISPDGPINLYNGIAVAASATAKGRGVLVVMNDQIFDAREVTKTHTTRTDTFGAPNSGPIGFVNFGEVHFNKSNSRKHTLHTPFDIIHANDLPKVEIIYEYAGTDGSLLASAINNGVKGIVIAGSGDGNIAEPERILLKSAREKGIVIVRSSRTGSGSVTYDYVDNLDSQIGLIPADDLNPQKARVLLMLALTKTNNPQLIKKYFASF